MKKRVIFWIAIILFMVAWCARTMFVHSTKASISEKEYYDVYEEMSGSREGDDVLRELPDESGRIEAVRYELTQAVQEKLDEEIVGCFMQYFTSRDGCFPYVYFYFRTADDGKFYRVRLNEEAAQQVVKYCFEWYDSEQPRPDSPAFTWEGGYKRISLA